jgi:hypothetical protein
MLSGGIDEGQSAWRKSTGPERIARSQSELREEGMEGDFRRYANAKELWHWCRLELDERRPSHAVEIKGSLRWKQPGHVASFGSKRFPGANEATQAVSMIASAPANREVAGKILSDGLRVSLGY